MIMHQLKADIEFTYKGVNELWPPQPYLCHGQEGIDLQVHFELLQQEADGTHNPALMNATPGMGTNDMKEIFLHQ